MFVHYERKLSIKNKHISRKPRTVQLRTLGKGDTEEITQYYSSSALHQREFKK